MQTHIEDQINSSAFTYRSVVKGNPSSLIRIFARLLLLLLLLYCNNLANILMSEKKFPDETDL